MALKRVEFYPSLLRKNKPYCARIVFWSFFDATIFSGFRHVYLDPTNNFPFMVPVRFGTVREPA